MMKQFVPSEVCLKCNGCCRFREECSVWAPCLLDEEILGLIDAPAPVAYLSLDKRIKAVINPKTGGFVCPFLDIENNKCKIYANRPFECQLYPFLICLRDKKVLLTVDLNCHYIKDKINTQEFKDHIGELITYLNSPSQLKLLKENPQILSAYEQVLDIVELNLQDENA